MHTSAHCGAIRRKRYSAHGDEVASIGGRDGEGPPHPARVAARPSSPRVRVLGRQGRDAGSDGRRPLVRLPERRGSRRGLEGVLRPGDTRPQRRSDLIASRAAIPGSYPPLGEEAGPEGARDGSGKSGDRSVRRVRPGRQREGIGNGGQPRASRLTVAKILKRSSALFATSSAPASLARA